MGKKLVALLLALLTLGAAVPSAGTARAGDGDAITLYYLSEIFKERGCASVRTCTLLDKPERRVVDLDVDYTGFVIPDKFVVGYGMDYDQRYRDLPFIGIVNFEED